MRGDQGLELNQPGGKGANGRGGYLAQRKNLSPVLVHQGAGAA